MLATTKDGRDVTYKPDPSRPSTVQPECQYCLLLFRDVTTYRGKNFLETVSLGQELHRKLGRKEAKYLDGGTLDGSQDSM